MVNKEMCSKLSSHKEPAPRLSAEAGPFLEPQTVAPIPVGAGHQLCKMLSKESKTAHLDLKLHLNWDLTGGCCPQPHATGSKRRAQVRAPVPGMHLIMLQKMAFPLAPEIFGNTFREGGLCTSPALFISQPHCHQTKVVCIYWPLTSVNEQ